MHPVADNKEGWSYWDTGSELVTKKGRLRSFLKVNQNVEE
jgi:hypothetical protein